MKKYTLTDAQLRKIANLAVQENGETAVAEEVSLMANLFELQSKYKDLYSYVRNGGWFYKAAFYMDNGKASDKAVEKARDVLANGNRTLPAYVNEHDCFSDIKTVQNNGTAFSKTDRSKYKKDVTKITNRYGSVYTFYCFPSPSADPFGYTAEAYKKKSGAETTQAAKAAASGSASKGNAADKVIQIAESEVGYLEKKSGKSLDSKTANAGSGNYTKYWRDMEPSLQAQAWCDCFVSWCFKQAYGAEEANRLLYGGLRSYYTPTSAQYYKNKKQWHTKNPKPGDQIFFQNTTRICHTGIVYKVDSTTVYTIEGNTSAGSQVIPNGGAVCKKSYALSNSRIAGYGRPAFNGSSSKEKMANKADEMPKTDEKVPNKTIKWYGTVNVSSHLKVRTWAGTENEETSFSPLDPGTRVGVCDMLQAEDGSEWLYIKIAGKYGFVSKKYIKRD